MFKKNKFMNENTSTLSENITIISSGTEITCTLFKSVGKVIIDGRIIGDVEIDGDVEIEVNGYIEGNIKAKHIVCSGDVTGNIKSDEITHLCQTANVYGDIASTSIRIDEGAVFCGNCKTEAKFFKEKETQEIKS
jgi:cytoskeletal protein CcmA (bactofilin family)